MNLGPLIPILPRPWCRRTGDRDRQEVPDPGDLRVTQLVPPTSGLKARGSPSPPLFHQRTATLPDHIFQTKNEVAWSDQNSPRLCSHGSPNPLTGPRFSLWFSHPTACPPAQRHSAGRPLLLRAVSHLRSDEAAYFSHLLLPPQRPESCAWQSLSIQVIFVE